jgi:integrase/recombinase XerD
MLNSTTLPVEGQGHPLEARRAAPASARQGIEDPVSTAARRRPGAPQYDYLDEARHAADTEGALFRPISNNRTGRLDNPITSDGVYKLVRRYALELGLKIGAHALRATAATNALDHDADITKVQEWLGHANIATTRIYDRRRSKVEDSPTFKVSY